MTQTTHETYIAKWANEPSASGHNRRGLSLKDARAEGRTLLKYGYSTPVVIIRERDGRHIEDVEA